MKSHAPTVEVFESEVEQMILTAARRGGTGPCIGNTHQQVACITHDEPADDEH